MGDALQAGARPGRSPRRHVLLGVGLLSGSILLLEIALTRYFSFHLWYHYAFMIISIAMLGLSASGSVLAISRHHRRGLEGRPVMTIGALLGGATILTALPLLARVNARWTSVMEPGTGHAFVALGLFWLVLFFPFFLAGCAISWAIATYTSDVGRVYGWDLAGAAAGCILAVVLLSTRPPEQAMAVAAAAAVAAGLSFAAVEVEGPGRRRGVAGLAALLMTASLATGLHSGGTPAGDATITPTKGLFEDLRSGGKLLATAAGMTGRVDVIATSRLDIWGLGPNARGPFPSQLVMRIDGDALTTITQYSADPQAWRFAEYLPSTLPHAIARRRNALIIGAGGGLDVVNAIQHGVPQVTAVEINRRVIDMVQGPFGPFAGNIYRDARVRVVHGDGRNFVERTTERFDLIQMTLVDTFAAISSGALSLAEDFLYTREAFEAYVRTLSPQGSLVMGRTNPEALALTALLERATRPLDLDLARHLFLARNPATPRGLVFLFHRAPLSAEEIARGLAFVEHAGLELVYAPGRETPPGADVARFLRTPDRDAFVAAFASDIRPETDDRPFYFRESKWSALLGTSSGGRGNLLVILGISVLFSLAFILLPLRLIAPTAFHRHWPLLAVFGWIGLGYIVLELSLMVQLTLFLGHPIRSLTVTLFSLLLASGLGSWASKALTTRPPTRSRGLIWLPFAGVAALALLYAFGLKPILTSLMGLSLPGRVAVAVAFVAPLGFLMGMPLPLTLSRLDRERHELVLWAWAINGTCSVIGSTACVLLAHLAGYRSVVVAAAACYLGALACLTLGRAGAAAEST